MGMTPAITNVNKFSAFFDFPCKSCKQTFCMILVKLNIIIFGSLTNTATCRRKKLDWENSSFYFVKVFWILCIWSFAAIPCLILGGKVLILLILLGYNFCSTNIKLIPYEAMALVLHCANKCISHLYLFYITINHYSTFSQFPSWERLNCEINLEQAEVNVIFFGRLNKPTHFQHSTNPQSVNTVKGRAKA